MRRWVLAAIGLTCFAAGGARADFEADLRAAGKLCREKKHEEAVQAYLKLGEGLTEPEERYRAIKQAAVCARLHLRSESRALELCRQVGAEPYAKACRATVYQWAERPPKVVAEFENEDFTTWPESLAAVGYAVRGSAYFRVQRGREAARDLLRAFQCARSYAKWSAFQKLGDTYWKLLDDEVLAEACYRKCMADFGGGYPGLQARVNLVELLVSQERHHEALTCLSGIERGGYWGGALLHAEAKVHAAKGDKAAAIDALQKALATVGINPHQKKECGKLLGALSEP